MSNVRSLLKHARRATRPIARQAGRVVGSRSARSLGSPGAYLSDVPIGGYIGWLRHANLGDEALFDAYARLFPDLHLLSYETAPPVELSLYRALIKRGPAYDAVFLGGGTLILHGEYLELCRHALDRGCRLAAFGTGVVDADFRQQFGANRDWQGRMRAWAQELNRFDFVGVRGDDSANALREAGVKDVQLTGDPAISACTSADPSRAETKRIAMNIGSFGPMFGSQDQVNEAAREAAAALSERGYQIDVFALHTADEKAGRWLCNQGVGARDLWTEFRSIERFEQRIAQYDLVIAQKLHGVVLPLACGVPAISIAYEPKCLDFMRSVNMEDVCFRTDQLRASDLVEAALRCLDDVGRARRRAIDECDRWRRVQREQAEQISSSLIRPSQGESA